MKEKVNHPKHYNSHPSGVECIDIVRWHNFNVGNVIKYLWRQGLKDGESNLDDLRKARFYLNDEIKRIENGNSNTQESNETDVKDSTEKDYDANSTLRLIREREWRALLKREQF